MLITAVNGVSGDADLLIEAMARGDDVEMQIARVDSKPPGAAAGHSPPPARAHPQPLSDRRPEVSSSTASSSTKAGRLATPETNRRS